MIVKFYVKRFILWRMILVSIFVAISFLPIAAQVPNASVEDRILPPSQEKFEERDQVVSPWRESDCDAMVDRFNQPDCYYNRHDKKSGYDTAHILTIYDDSGLIWYRFSIAPENPDHFTKKTKTGFLPFSLTHQKWKGLVILRMVGESPHWYKVEVNENTQATQYVLKSDPMWVKKQWSFWLYEGGTLELSESNSFLSDKPNGKVIEETIGQNLKVFYLIKVEGDWAYGWVEIPPNNNRYEGWVRWKKDRDLLVGCGLNDKKVPAIKINTENN